MTIINKTKTKPFFFNFFFTKLTLNLKTLKSNNIQNTQELLCLLHYQMSIQSSTQQFQAHQHHDKEHNILNIWKHSNQIYGNHTKPSNQIFK